MALTQISTKGIKDGTITNADINANAAIAGTKIDTDFGNQNLVTTGSIHATNLDISGITTNNSMDIMFSTNNDGNARTVAVDSTAGKFSYNPSENRLFVDNINMPDNGVLNIGSGTGTAGDLQLFHDGSHSHIVSNTGNLRILADGSGELVLTSKAGEEAIVCAQDGSVEIMHDNSKKFETTSSGIKVTGDASTGTIIQGAFSLRDTTSSSDRIKWIPNSPYVLRWSDSFKASFGSGDDLQIFHNGTDSIIDNTTGELQITTDAVMRFNATEYKFNNAANNEKIANFFQDGACELYFNHQLKLETLSNGIKVTGNIDLSAELNMTDGADAQRFIDAAVGTSALTFRGCTSGDANHQEMARFFRGGACELNHSGLKKLETTTTGISVTGRADLSGNLIIDSNSPQVRLDEADTTTSTRLLMSGGQFYLQTAASGQGTSTSAGVINLTGYNNTTASQINLKATTTIAHGDLRPSANNSFDLGTSSIRWRNLYTNDLHLSNEGGKNDVDGTYGSYTIQEGAEDLFLINRRNGKKYKFNLTEVS